MLIQPRLSIRPVIPAQAGIQSRLSIRTVIPAQAGIQLFK